MFLFWLSFLKLIFNKLGIFIEKLTKAGNYDKIFLFSVCYHVCNESICYAKFSDCLAMFIHTIVDSMNTCLIWFSNWEIGAVQLCSVTEIAPPQLFVFVNRSPIQYDFRGDRKALRYCVNIALILNKFCQ